MERSPSRSRPRVSLLAAAAALTLVLAAPAVAEEVVSVDLEFIPATPQFNTLTVTLSVVTTLASSSDTESSTVSGLAPTDLTAAFNHATARATVTELWFAGGRAEFSDMSFDLSFGPFGHLFATTTGVTGTFRTPVPHAPVFGDTFPAGNHAVLLNEGIVDTYATGAISNAFDPITVNLSEDEVPVTGTGDGGLTVSTPTVAAGVASYDVTLVLPVVFDQEMYNEGGVVARFAGSGKLKAVGSFSRPVPVLGDLDGNGAVNAADIDALWAHVPSADPAWDVDGNGAVDVADVDALVRDVLAGEYGDADLDGAVDAGDYLALKRSAERLAGGTAGWADGDFDGDGRIGRADLRVLADHAGWTAGGDAAPLGAAVPEPATLALLAAALLALPRRRRAA